MKLHARTLICAAIGACAVSSFAFAQETNVSSSPISAPRVGPGNETAAVAPAQNNYRETYLTVFGKAPAKRPDGLEAGDGSAVIPSLTYRDMNNALGGPLYSPVIASPIGPQSSQTLTSIR